MPSQPLARIGAGYGIAKDVICVDFDGTIIEWSDIDETNPTLKPGVVDALKALKAKGKRILIFTSRMSQKWLDYEGRKAYDQYHHVRDILAKNDIPFHDIIGEKVPAEAYIDDMAVGFRDDWAAVLDELGMGKALTEYFMPRYWSGGNQRWHEVGVWSDPGYSAVPLCRLPAHTATTPYHDTSCYQRGGYCPHYLNVHETQKTFTPPENLCKHCARVSAKRAASAQED